MKRYIFAIVTILLFSGCQQALNEFNQSLAQNLNSNFNTNNFSSNITKVSDEELKQRFVNYKTVRNSLFKKILVKIDALEEDFNEKFKNKEQLIKERNEVYKFLVNEIIYFEDYASKYNNFIILNEREFSINTYIKPPKYTITPSGSFGDSDLDSKYFGYYIDNKRVFGYEIDTVEKYEKYLTWAKSTQFEQAIYKKDIEDRKKANEKLIAKEKEERAKVKGACDKWLEKARKDVYSLGVGDFVINMSRKEAGGTYQIRAVEKNTFLLYAYIWGELYGQKSDYIPESALKTAPSIYCYK